MTNHESEQIREQMARIRRDLNDDVEAVVENAKELTDWRGFVRRNPLLTVGAAAAVGFLLVPNRMNIISPSADELEKLAKKNRLVVKPKADVKRQAGMVSPLLNLIGGAMMRTAFTMAGQQVSKVVESNSAVGNGSPAEASK